MIMSTTPATPPVSPATKMMTKLLSSALFAGIAGGLIVALLHIFVLSPIIIEAEEYESGNKYHFAGVLEGADSGHHASMEEANDGHHHEADEESWAARSLRTGLSSVLTTLGYAFMLIAGFAIAERGGITVTARSGVLWGLGGFTAFHLATGFGLPPELPGSSAAILEQRQFWWLGTAIATIFGLASLAFGKNWLHWGLGIVLIALPHIIGAPHPHSFGGVVPPELQGEFVTLSLGVAAVGWATLGLLAGFMWHRQKA